MEKQTGAQRNAEADRRNENSAGTAAVERTAVQEESGGTEAFGFLFVFFFCPGLLANRAPGIIY